MIDAVTSQPLPNTASPQSAQPSIERRVGQVALVALAKGAAVLVSGAIIVQFVAAPASVILLSWSVGSLVGLALVNLVARGAIGGRLANALEAMSDFTLVNNANLLGPGIAIHEFGHAVAGILFLTNPQPSISITPFQGGVTNLNLQSSLTSLGAKLGMERVIGAIGLGGLAASTFFVLLELAVAHFSRESSPQLGRFLRCHAMGQLLNEVMNGLGALVGEFPNPCNDLVRVRALWGLHPALVLAVAVLLPILEQLLFYSSSLLGVTSISSLEPPPEDLHT